MTCEISITGIGCVTSAGVGTHLMWSAVKRGNPESPSFRDGDSGRLLAPSAAELELSLGDLGYPRPPRTTLMALNAAQEAWGMAALPDELVKERVGIIINRTFGQQNVSSLYLNTLWSKGPSAVSGLQFVQTTANAVLGKLCIKYGLRGPSLMTFGSPCVQMAIDMLLDDSADAVLCGGLDELSEYVLDLLSFGRLSAGTGVSRPTAGREKGLTPSEGACFLVLERAEFSERRLHAPLGFIRGCAANGDRAAILNPAQRSKVDVERCISSALIDASVDGSRVRSISSAAIGLETHDSAEREALTSLFGQDVSICSPKKLLGETWGASGPLSILTALFLAKDSQLGSRVRNRPHFESNAPELGLAMNMDWSGQTQACIVEPIL